MAKVLYSQGEADWMIGLPKIALREADIFRGLSTFHLGAKWLYFDAFPQDSTLRPVPRFKIRTEANVLIGAYCIVLEGGIGTQPMEGICRYDVHNSMHPNNCICCSPPPQIWPGHFHRHRYNECTVRRGNPWDKCADLLTIADDENFERQVRELIGRFIIDMKLSFSDAGTIRELFGTGKSS